MKILVREAKHYTDYFAANTLEEIHGAALHIMEENRAMFLYGSPNPECPAYNPVRPLVDRILTERDGASAWKLLSLRHREGHEYEIVYLENVAVITNKT